MITVGHHSVRLTAEPLEDSLPLGMYAPDGDQGAQNALRAFRIVESILRERSATNALAARYALLQSFPRLVEVVEGEEAASAVILDVPDFIRQYALALCPASYAEYITQLTEAQVEILLKHVLHAHECWGHDRGMGMLIRSMLEGSAHAPIEVRVVGLEGEGRPIPSAELSLLGRKENFSYLGKDFVLGREVLSRPERYEILVGPLSREVLESFRSDGWAEGSQPSRKLERLADLAEPFYLRARIRFLLESSTKGFVLARGTLGTGTLGVSA